MKRFGAAVSIALLVVLAAACVPVRHAAVDYLNEVAGDSAVISPAADGLTFDPGPSTALDVILVAEGTSMATGDERCAVERSSTRIRCEIPLVSESITLIMSGHDVVANASYRREAFGRIYLTTLVN